MTKRNMVKVNRIRASKFMVFVVCSLFIIAYFVPVGTILAAQPEDEWVAYPMHIIQLSGSSDPLGYSPAQIRVAYGLPSSGGAGTTIAIIDAYYTPSIKNDLTVFSNQTGLPPPTASNFEVHNMSTTLSTANSNWPTETCLDVEWAHAIAPDAKILLVEAVNNTRSSLLSAINYATSRSDVVAISMSWGINEGSWETSYDSFFTSSYGAAFFASSGDSGSGVIWPASSPNVVAVGGTTLNLSPNGTVISETAWNESGGGISTYEPIPSYQTSYGLSYPKRAVPDVSYDANPSTGVSVYCNSSWYKVGGTSAGAPQWAAIQALGLSATNANLYKDAKLAYSSYFRDITSGSNGNPATPGYDLVTGLGSPLTYNFGTYLTVSPTSGPAGGVITLNGVGFTAGSSVNISYLNPLSSAWVPIVNNLSTDSQNFTYTLNATDLLRNNTAGDNQPLFDNIVFRAQDNSTGHSYNTTIPYTEWRRGLAQLGNNAATGLYGNNTNLATSAFVQNGQSIIVAGEWFSPGNVSLLWDGTINLGTIATDGTGLLNATVLVPTTTAGQHMITINDGVSNFCVNLTRLPTVTNDYDGLWHTTDFAINLTPDFNVTQTYYRINNGPIYNVTASGQPVITTENSNNTLEYWSTWSVYGTGTMELPHVILTGIQLQTTPPAGSLQINGGAPSTSSSNVTLTVSATDSLSGISQIRFSNDGSWDQASWEPYISTETWQLTSGDGLKTVYCQIKDNAGLITNLSSSIILSTPQPSPSPSPSATSSPSSTQSPSSTPAPSPAPSESPSPEPSAAPEVPELSIQMILVLLAMATLSFAVKYRRKAQ
jgi:cell division septation protein DedD